MMGIGNTTWNAMKSFLSQSGILKNILNFDARTISKASKI